MSRERDPHKAQNLRRWQEAGAPQRWIEACQGRWGHDDWLALLAGLERSPYWPLEPEAVGGVLEESRRRWWNLRRWQRSGQARAWVDARQGQWGHGDWLALLESLRGSEFWPLEPQAVGAVLEEVQGEWRNLRRWEQSGHARRWVEDRQGRWGHGDCLALWATLQTSDYWPLDFKAVEGVLKRVTAEWCNLGRWQQCGQPRLWVQAHQGQWGHDDWLRLLEALRVSPFWPLAPEAVGNALEESKRRYWNLRRWQEGGEAARWLAAHGGVAGRQERLALVEALRWSEFWPLDLVRLEVVLEELQAGPSNLRRWEESGQPHRWVEARQGEWNHDDWLALVAALKHTEFWPLDLGQVGESLRARNVEWWNLRRWRASGLARQWVEAHQGQWGGNDWHRLLAALRASEFWPVDPAALGRVLEESREGWRNLRRWLESGQPRRWLECHPGGWGAQDLLALLKSLERSEFWPLDPEAVGQLLELLPPRASQAA